MSISQINTQLEVMRNEWLSNKDKRVQSVSESNLLLSSALSKNTSIIDKIVNSTHTNINSTNGPHIDLDIYDLVHISKIFPIRTIAKCVKFIYTYEAHCQFAEHVPAKRKLCDSFGKLEYGLQKYDYASEQPRNYSYYSNRHYPVTKKEPGKTYILSKVIVSHMDNDVIVAAHAQPLYKITFNETVF
ncbi:hypothetical protein EXVG_00320 [Emiliania huxleyi virus 202]|nr:hypothetical protein EXVG_00320 [Emiliania huxleyi virus 202]AHA54231.1 hypothetical protein EhV18_00184 [Emiliania huxleyi virus 18]AHA55278.1 hypothetical protein EhV156_00182 [Emiliania huxleyi virus 156]